MKTFSRLVFFVFLTFCPLTVWSVVPDTSSPCVQQLETNFFQYSLVIKAFALYQVPQGLWDPITQRLQVLSNGIPDRMKKQTANMVPNPIEYPMNRFETAKILKGILFQVFLEALRDFQANERPTADYMFDYIFTQQLPNFVGCFGPEASKLKANFE